jgi:signal transduction histidine kinase
MIYQYTTLVQAVNAVENIYSGRMLRRWFGLIDWRTMERTVEAFFDDLGFPIDIHVPVHKLAPAQQHMVEFARAILMRPDVIIVDEIANKLTPMEMKYVYRSLFEARDRGAAMLYISHDLDEVLQLADCVTILRDGYRRGTEATRNLDKYRLFQLTYSFSLDSERLEHSRMKFLLLKQHLENIINYVPVAAVILDPASTIQLANLRVSEILELDPDQLLDCAVDSALWAFPSEYVSQVQRAINARKHIRLREIELTEQRQVNVDVVPLRDDDNTFLGSALLFENVSMDRSMQDYLIQSEKMASVAEVAVGVAHEINNPLFIIKNYLQVIKEKSQDPAMTERLEKIDREATRIMETISSLLSFSRTPQQRQPELDLSDAVEDVVTLLSHNLKEKNINLREHIELERAPLRGDENKLKQVIMNLLMNSIDAVLDNGQIEIALRENEGGQYYELRVRDNGYGIPEDVAESIFNPFFSTKITKKNTGLGLSICRTIVEDHGGSIDFTSTPGEHTEFIVHLPSADGSITAHG